MYRLVCEELLNGYWSTTYDIEYDSKSQLEFFLSDELTTDDADLTYRYTVYHKPPSEWVKVPITFKATIG